MVDFEDASAFNRYIAAGSAYTTISVLRHLAHDADSQIRRRVAENPLIPRDLIDLLIHDESVDVRIALSENTQIAAEYVELFLLDDSPDVRFALAENHFLPSEILLRLAVDENPYVANRARKTYVQCNPHAAHELVQLTMPPPAVRREAS